MKKENVVLYDGRKACKTVVIALVLIGFLGAIPYLGHALRNSELGGQSLAAPSSAPPIGDRGVNKRKRLGELYSIGGRPQRVRFLLAAHGQTFAEMQKFLGPEGSLSIRKLIEDPIQSMPNVPQGKYIRQSKPPAAPGVGLDSFAEGDTFYAGEVINPGLVMCSANLLDLVKAAGDEFPSLFEAHSINEVNLFVRAVPVPTGEDTLRVGVGPAAVSQPGSALDVLVEDLPLELKCSLPTLEELQDRLAKLE